MAGMVRICGFHMASVLLLAACSEPVPKPPVYSVNPIDVVIASAVSEAARASPSLPASGGDEARGSRVRGMVRVIPPSNEAGTDPQRRVEVRWNGAIEPLVRLTARYFGYLYRAEENRPPAPIVVNMSLADATFLEVVSEINRAARGLARVDVGEGPSLNLSYAR